MPTPNQKTAPKAFYRAEMAPVRARTVVQDGTVDIRDADGELMDQIPAAAGDVIVAEAGNHWAEPGAMFASKFDPLPGTDGLWLPKGCQVMELEQPLEGPEAGDFRNARYYRCAQDGSPFCPITAPLSWQAHLISQAVEGDSVPQARKAALMPSARMHMQVLSAIRAGLSPDVINSDNAVMAYGDIRQFDVIAALFGENIVEEERELPGGGLMPQDIPGALSDAMRPGAASPDWMRLGDFAAMMGPMGGPSLDKLRTYIFADLTEIPTAEIMVTAEFSFMPDPNDALGGLLDWLRKEGEHRPLRRAPDLSNLAPGYEATVDRFASSGVEMLVVSDAMGEYVYAWPDTAVPSPSPR